MDEKVKKVLDDSFDETFARIYFALHKIHPHPFDWLHLMHKPSWWRFRARKAYYEQCAVFASYGFIVNDAMADTFFKTEPQRYDEDAGGSFVRRLRQTFQYQTGIPYEN